MSKVAGFGAAVQRRQTVTHVPRAAAAGDINSSGATCWSSTRPPCLALGFADVGFSHGEPQRELVRERVVTVDRVRLGSVREV
jgi:hypothetical protein